MLARCSEMPGCGAGITRFQLPRAFAEALGTDLPGRALDHVEAPGAKVGQLRPRPVGCVHAFRRGCATICAVLKRLPVMQAGFSVAKVKVPVPEHAEATKTSVTLHGLCTRTGAAPSARLSTRFPGTVLEV